MVRVIDLSSVVGSVLSLLHKGLLGYEVGCGGSGQAQIQ